MRTYFDYSKLSIQKDVPIPPPRGENSKREVLSKFLISLKVGDSFVLPTKQRTGSLFHCAKRLQIKLTSRKLGDHVRIWRVRTPKNESHKK